MPVCVCVVRERERGGTETRVTRRGCRRERRGGRLNKARAAGVGALPGCGEVRRACCLAKGGDCDDVCVFLCVCGERVVERERGEAGVGVIEGDVEPLRSEGRCVYVGCGWAGGGMVQR